MTAIQQPDGFFAVNRSGEFFSHFGRQARDLHDKYQQGTRREIEDLVKREHAKVDGQRFTTIAAVYSDGRIDQHPLPEETPPEPAKPASEPEQAPAVSESETGAGADQTPSDSLPAQPSTEIKISNAKFMVGLFGPLPAGHYCWTTAFVTSPKQASKKEWAGNSCTPESVADAPHGNAYMSVAMFKRGSNTSLRRDTTHFAALPVIVLDDISDSNIQPTYKLETSPSNYQIGFKLKEPITNVGVARRLMQSLAKARLVKPDSSGNNAVRYVRTPVALNTKSDPPFKCRLHTLDFDITYMLDELIDAFGLDRDFILRGDDRVPSNIKVGHGTPCVGDDYLAPDQPDDGQLADLESAIDYLCGTPFADDRDNWIKIGLALRTYIRGRGLWLKLSASSGKFRPDVDPQNWETFKPATAHWKQVFKFAQDMGWQNPCTPFSEALAMTEALLAGTPAPDRVFGKNEGNATMVLRPGVVSSAAVLPWLPPPPAEPQSGPCTTPEAAQSGVPSAEKAAKQAENVEKRLKSLNDVKVWANSEVVVPEHLKSFPNDKLEMYRCWFNRCAEDTVNSISVTGVIHLAAAVCARGARSNMDNHTSLYIAVIALTGFGKNYTKKAVVRLLQASEVDSVVSGDFYSRGGIYSAMLASPTVIFHLDEFGEKIKLGVKDGSSMSGAFSYVKEVYSGCGSVLPKPSYATATLPKANAEALRAVKYPCVNLYCLTTPGQLWDGIDNASVEGGFLNRFVGVIADSEEAVTNETPEFDPPGELVTHIRYVRKHLAGDGDLGDQKFTSSDIEPSFCEYHFDAESRRLLSDFKRETADMGKADDFMGQMAVRWRENSMRMALALHVFSNPTHDVINSTLTKWCIDYVRFYCGQFAKAVLEHSQPKSEYGRLRRDFLLAFRKQPNGVPPSSLGRQVPWKHVRGQLRKEIIDDLKESGLLALVEKPNKGQRGPRGSIYVALAES